MLPTWHDFENGFFYRWRKSWTVYKKRFNHSRLLGTNCVCLQNQSLLLVAQVLSVSKETIRLLSITLQIFSRKKWSKLNGQLQSVKNVQLFTTLYLLTCVPSIRPKTEFSSGFEKNRILVLSWYRVLQINGKSSHFCLPYENFDLYFTKERSSLRLDCKHTSTQTGCSKSFL